MTTTHPKPPAASAGQRTHTACRNVLCSVFLIVGLMGCAGTVIVEYAIEPQVLRRDEKGHTSLAHADQFSVTPLPAGMLVAFPPVEYHGAAFDWTISTSAHGFGGAVKNRIDSPICFRFDQARLASSANTVDHSLRVTFMSYVHNRAVTTIGSNRPDRQVLRTAQPLCFAPKSTTRFSLWPDLSGLFPNQTMFNVRWPEGNPVLTERGIGNWVRIVLPIEYDGKRETLEITLRAIDSKARISHY